MSYSKLYMSHYNAHPGKWGPWPPCITVDVVGGGENIRLRVRPRVNSVIFAQN